MIVITDNHLRHFSPAQILGLRSSSQLTLSDVAANYVPEAFKQLRKLLEDGFSEHMQQGDVLGSPEAVKGFLRLRMEGLEHEEFHVLWLNCANRLICADRLFRGTLSQTSVYPREVVKLALTRNAAAAILVHNHPSGTAEQSRADDLLTRSLKDALRYVDVKVQDHLIVAPGHMPLSFAEKGLL